MKNRGDDPPPEDREEAETSFNNDDDREVETNELEWDDTTFGDPNNDVRKNPNKMKKADRDLGQGIGVKLKNTNIKKIFFSN